MMQSLAHWKAMVSNGVPELERPALSFQGSVKQSLDHVASFFTPNDLGIIFRSDGILCFQPLRCHCGQICAASLPLAARWTRHPRVLWWRVSAAMGGVPGGRGSCHVASECWSGQAALWTEFCRESTAEIWVQLWGAFGGTRHEVEKSPVCICFSDLTWLNAKAGSFLCCFCFLNAMLLVTPIEALASEGPLPNRTPGAWQKLFHSMIHRCKQVCFKTALIGIWSFSPWTNESSQVNLTSIPGPSWQLPAMTLWSSARAATGAMGPCTPGDGCHRQRPSTLRWHYRCHPGNICGFWDAKLWRIKRRSLQKYGWWLACRTVALAVLDRMGFSVWSAFHDEPKDLKGLCLLNPREKTSFVGN